MYNQGVFNCDGVDEVTPQVITGGVAFIVSDTKPTTRYNSATGLFTGGDALVAGDRWYKNDDGTSWFFNGTYWLSSNLYKLRGWTGRLGANTTLNNQLDSPVASSSVFIEKNVISAATGVGTHDASNYFLLDWGVQASTTANRVGSITTDTIAGFASNATITEIVINTAYSGFKYADARFTKVGSTGNLRRTSMTLTYRLIAA